LSIPLGLGRPCQCPRGWAGLDLSMPLGLGRSGLVNALGLGRSGLVNAFEGLASLDLPMPCGKRGLTKSMPALGSRHAWTYQRPWLGQA